MKRLPPNFPAWAWIIVLTSAATARADHIQELQTRAVAEGKADWGQWGGSPDKYSGWNSHSNRLVPIYTFGLTLDAVNGENSPYRDAGRIERLYGRTPTGALNPEAQYFDQTNVHDLQAAAVAAGTRRIILFVFDGLDWQTAWAAAIHRSGEVGYHEGRGNGLAFLDYAGTTTDFGWFVSSPHNHGTQVDVNAQRAINPGGTIPGGYDASRGGGAPWDVQDASYLMGLAPDRKQAVTDSASSATSLCAGIKTYNDAINVDFEGNQVLPIARRLQEQGLAIGVVTSVPISHATPACAYANNVSRDDFQDLTRDLVGLPSIAHREPPLEGVDVLIGTGWGVEAATDPGQGTNFMPGNRYLAAPDLAAIDVAQGGRYRVSQRTAGMSGAESLAAAAELAASNGQRLLGYFGLPGGYVGEGHLPFQTADGQYDPVAGIRAAEHYQSADMQENPTLADMTKAALTVLDKDPEGLGFWLMVEAGDVDWANHDNNLDNSIGAVLSGDEAISATIEWIETHGGWDQTALIVTADHGHFLVLRQPEALLPPASQ